MNNSDKRMEPDTRRGITLAAVLSPFRPYDHVFIERSIGPHELEAVGKRTVQELQTIKCMETCGDCKVKRLGLTVDEPGRLDSAGYAGFSDYHKRTGGMKMGVCKGCGATIDWIRTKDGRYMPVEPEPVFIVEGDGFDRYVTDEGEVITGRRALLSEQNALCEVAFVPHWKNCPEARRFQRK